SSYLTQNRQLRLITAEFLSFSALRIIHRPGVFQKGPQRAIGKTQATAESVRFHLCDDAEALGVALKGLQIGTLNVTQPLQKMRIAGFAEPVPDGVFAGMTVGRITNIVSQTSGLHQRTDIIGVQPQWQFIAQRPPDPGAQRAANTDDFQTVSQTTVYMVVLGQRMHLSFTVEAAKG